jgi:hypothetical protein
MNASLSLAAKVKWARLLSLLASERDAADPAAPQQVQSAGPAWRQILSPPVPDRPLPGLGSWRQTVRQCLERPDSLRPWEIGFLRDLSNFRRLSVKQRYCLKEIADRVLRHPGGDVVA